jgi:acyl carrier protein
MERKGQLKVIPLGVEPCNPPALWTSYKMISFRGGYENGLRQLAATLELGKKLPSPTLCLEPTPSLLPMSQIKERVREIVSEQFVVHISNVRPETNLIYDLNADELDKIELVMEFEDTFDIAIPEDEAEKLHTVRDWAAYITQTKLSPESTDTTALGQETDKITVPPQATKSKKTVKKKIKTEKGSPVTFRAHWPFYTMPKLPTDLLVYLYSGLPGEKKADKDLARHIKQPEKLDFDTAGPVYIKDGTKILIRPEMPGFRFKPEDNTVTWHKDWLPVEFRMVPLLKGPFAKRGKKLHGQVEFFVGPLLIAEININVIIKDQLSEDEIANKVENESSVYQKIFPSYSHKDSEIVEKIEAAYEAFGNEYMRDVRTLRSGEEWDPELLAKIKEANVFHLFWSEASEKSEYVRKEWLTALKRRKRNFIRPAFWKQPMPEPPPELRKFHFKNIEKMVQRLMA